MTTGLAQIDMLTNTARQSDFPTLFQTVALAILALLFSLTLAAMLLGKATRKEAFTWSGVWILGAIAIVNPDLTIRVARWLGIGRGADLLLYCSVGIMVVGFMLVYIRLRKIQRELTSIVRHLAIRDADLGKE